MGGAKDVLVGSIVIRPSVSEWVSLEKTNDGVISKERSTQYPVIHLVNYIANRLYSPIKQKAHFLNRFANP